MSIRTQKAMKKTISAVLLTTVIVSLFLPAFCVTAEKAVSVVEKNEASVSEADGYFANYENYKKINKPQKSVALNASEGKSSATLSSENDVSYVRLNETNRFIEWTFNVEESGVYNIETFYRQTEDFQRDIAISVTIDGKTPFDEASQLTLPRIYKSNYKNDGYPFEKNKQGDDIRPDQVQSPIWTSACFENPVGLYDEPYLFFFEAGTHTLQYELAETAVEIEKVIIFNESYIKYDEYLKEHQSDTVSGNNAYYQQAEIYENVNNKNIYANNDKNNAATMPNDPKNSLLNTVGGSGWALQGDSVSWKVDVKKPGLYRVIVRARQNVNSGLFSYRSLKINGKIPFEEAKSIAFSYSQDWKIHTLGSENGLMLYLEPGDILTLTCTTGGTSQILRSIQNTSDSLTAVYRQIIAITSASPDPYQDYKLEDKIPDLESNLRTLQNQLSDTYNKLCKILGTKGSLASSLKYSSENVKEFADKPYEISERLSSFSNTVETLGSLISSLEQQPLEMDWIAYLEDNAELPKSGTGFFKSAKFGFKQFMYSFTNDYGIVSVDSDAEKTIKVWVSTGRDQAQVLSEIVNSDFVQKYNAGVELSLVDTSTTLLRASLAGKGPDVALMVAQTYPVELAARGALVDLTPYIDNDFKSNFHESALTSFYYNNKLYALPESQSFPVIFYRTDIFKQLGITLPNTWEEFYSVMEVIQSNNLALGLPEVDSTNYAVSASLNIFEALLVQNGEMFYNKNLSKTRFDTETAYQAFTDWARLYTDYGLDREVSFYNRFRTGEIPFAIRNIGEYLQIKVAAPEINGKWDIAPIPGTLRSDGTINRSISSTVTGCIVLKAAKSRGVEKEAVNFIKWWVGNEAQEKYGRNLEVTLGTAGRYFSANLNAFEKTDWSTHEFEVLNSQRSFVVNQPSIPGSYAVSRDLTSALREVIEGTNRPRRALMLYNSDINEEIARKRKEFEVGDTNEEK